jgi:hypothetical protein
MRQHVKGVHALQAQHVLLLLVIKTVILLCRGIVTASFTSLYGVCQRKLGGLSLVNLFLSLSSPLNCKLVLFVFYFLASVPFLLIFIFFLSLFVKILSFQFSPLIPICRVFILSLFF